MKEFVNYLYSMRFLPNANRSVKNLIISVAYALGLALVLLSVMGDGAVSFLLAVIGFCSAFSLFWTRKAKPNINTLLPITHKRRLAFELLSVPVFFVLVSAVVLTFMFTEHLLVTIIVLIATSDSQYLFKAMFDVYTEGFSRAFCNVYCSLILIFGVIYIIGASMIYSHTDSFKRRILTAVGMFVYAAVGAQIILQFSQRSYYKGAAPMYYVFGQAGVYMENGRFAWLAVLMVALSGCASIAFGIYLTVIKNRAKTY